MAFKEIDLSRFAPKEEVRYTEAQLKTLMSFAEAKALIDAQLLAVNPPPEEDELMAVYRLYKEQQDQNLLESLTKRVRDLKPSRKSNNRPLVLGPDDGSNTRLVKLPLSVWLVLWTTFFVNQDTVNVPGIQ